MRGKEDVDGHGMGWRWMGLSLFLGGSFGIGDYGLIMSSS